LQSLLDDALVNYFTRGQHVLTQRFLQEMVRVTCRASPEGEQLHCSSDFGVVALVLSYPKEKVGAWPVLLRLLGSTPFQKWRSLIEFVTDLEKQKAAFYQVSLTEASVYLCQWVDRDEGE
jgi:hypothetical protein